MAYLIDPEGNETRVIHELCNFGDKDALEVGCGDGRLTWRYAAHARSVLGLDPNPLMIDRAIAATPDDLQKSVTFRVESIVDVDLPPAAFDVAILSWSL